MPSRTVSSRRSRTCTDLKALLVQDVAVAGGQQCGPGPGPATSAARRTESSAVQRPRLAAAAQHRTTWTPHAKPRNRTFAGPCPKPCGASGGATADVRPARRRRVELSRGGRRNGDFDRDGDEPAVLRSAETEGDARGASAAMTTEPDDLPAELLAAYVDGELGPRDRSRVERWLAERPEAREFVETQESLARANGDLWCGLTPPRPEWPAMGGNDGRNCRWPSSVASSVGRLVGRGVARDRWGNHRSSLD